MTRPLAIDAVIVTDDATRPGTLLAAEGRIAALAWTAGDRAALRARAAEVLDASHCWLLPGLVDAHAHAYAGLLRGTESSLPLELWALFTTIHGRALDARALRAAILLGAAERLRAGYTALVDHTPYAALAEVALAAHEASGLRVGYAPFLHDLTDYELMGLPLPPALADMARLPPLDADAFAARFAAVVAAARAGSGRVVPMLGPNAPQRCSPAARALWRRLRDRHDVPVHTHLLETRAQRRAGQERWPGGIVAAMAQDGLLDGWLSLAHCVWLDPAEAETLARHGATVVHNPASNLMLGSGLMPYAAHRRAGLPLALGTDSANTGGRHDGWEAMRLAFMLHRAPGSDPASWPRAPDVLHMGTQAGAAVLGIDAGRLRPGALADLVLVRRTDATTLLGEESLEGLLLHANATAVDRVFVGGVPVFAAGRVLAFDEDAALADAAGARTEVSARAAPRVAGLRAALPALAAHLRRYTGD